MFEHRPIPPQQSNGRDHSLPPQSNTNPQFSSVLPSTSVLEADKATQAQLVRGVQDLPFVISDTSVEFRWASKAAYGSNIAPTTTATAIASATASVKSANAKDLEVAGEVALFREIMKDWGFNDQQASYVLGYNDPSFATELFKGLTSIRHRDAEIRLDLVITIAVDLEALYRDYDVIQKWLRKPHDLLNGATPMTLAMEGTSLDLLKLSEYVAYLSGR
jgi:hypothetical protein